MTTAEPFAANIRTVGRFRSTVKPHKGHCAARTCFALDAAFTRLTLVVTNEIARVFAALECPAAGLVALIVSLDALDLTRLCLAASTRFERF